MTDEQEKELADVATVLDKLAKDIFAGARRDPYTIAKDLSLLAAIMTPVDELKGWLNQADAAAIDRFLDLLTEARLGPKP